eukprot:COSAG04_NODE_618_length_11896_cov_81.925659_16_plen_174_part_00
MITVDICLPDFNPTASRQNAFHLWRISIDHQIADCGLVQQQEDEQLESPATALLTLGAMNRERAMRARAAQGRQQACPTRTQVRRIAFEDDFRVTKMQLIVARKGLVADNRLTIRCCGFRRRSRRRHRAGGSPAPHRRPPAARSRRANCGASRPRGAEQRPGAPFPKRSRDSN